MDTQGQDQDQGQGQDQGLVAARYPPGTKLVAERRALGGRRRTVVFGEVVRVTPGGKVRVRELPKESVGEVDRLPDGDAVRHVRPRMGEREGEREGKAAEQKTWIAALKWGVSGKEELVALDRENAEEVPTLRRIEFRAVDLDPEGVGAGDGDGAEREKAQTWTEYYPAPLTDPRTGALVDEEKLAFAGARPKRRAAGKKKARQKRTDIREALAPLARAAEERGGGRTSCKENT
jgi:hypothetical protein